MHIPVIPEVSGKKKNEKKIFEQAWSKGNTVQNIAHHYIMIYRKVSIL